MYNLREIKSISVADVARSRGISLEQKNGRLWGKLRNEKTASFSINIGKNLWFDFGAAKGGSVIDLVMELDGIDKTEAINKLAEEYGFKNEVTRGWHPLTDSQYRELGIEPERATMNFNFDLRVHTIEQLTRWENKYGMPLKQLAQENPESYNKLVLKIGKDHINSLREMYLSKVKMALDPNFTPKQRELYKTWAENNSKEINSKVDLLERAFNGNGTFIKKLYVNPLNDFKHFQNPNITQSNTQSSSQANNQLNSLDKTSRHDIEIRERIVKTYKEIFNFPQADFLSVDQAKSLQIMNSTFTESENKYLPIQQIKELYKFIGKSLQTIEASYNQHIKEGEYIPKDGGQKYDAWLEKYNNLKGDLLKQRDLFSICSSVIEALRCVTIAYKNDIAKQNQLSTNKPLMKDMDLSR